jgi:hypothetical protein
MRFAPVLVLALLLVGCVNNPSKEEEEAAQNSLACLLDGERLVIRFDTGMARLLLPSGDLVWLYQIPAASGMRYSNGNLELRGKGTDLSLVDTTTGTQTALQCAHYTVPKQ